MLTGTDAHDERDGMTDDRDRNVSANKSTAPPGIVARGVAQRFLDITTGAPDSWQEAIATSLSADYPEVLAIVPAQDASVLRDVREAMRKAGEQSDRRFRTAASRAVNGKKLVGVWLNDLTQDELYQYAKRGVVDLDDLTSGTGPGLGMLAVAYRLGVAPDINEFAKHVLVNPAENSVEAALAAESPQLKRQIVQYLDDEETRRAGQPELRQNQMPDPPWPGRDNPMLAHLINRARRDLEEVGQDAALVQLAVHAWFEGHIEGFDAGWRAARGES